MAWIAVNECGAVAVSGDVGARFVATEDASAIGLVLMKGATTIVACVLGTKGIGVASVLWSAVLVRGITIGGV